MRSLQWKQQKTEKNNQLKQQLSDKEKYMCTFNPQTFTKEKSVCDTGLVFVKDSEKYRNRVKEAELERDFKQECLNKYSGKNWKRQITIPKESKLVNPAASYKTDVNRSPIKDSGIIKDAIVDDKVPFEEAQKLLHQKLTSMEL